MYIIMFYSTFFIEIIIFYNEYLPKIISLQFYDVTIFLNKNLTFELISAKTIQYF